MLNRLHIILVRYEELEHEDLKVKYLWESLEHFSHEDRSRFIRFVTGRRRLPAPIHVFSGLVAGCLLILFIEEICRLFCSCGPILEIPIELCLRGHLHYFCSDGQDILPSSSTCANTLFLPTYSRSVIEFKFIVQVAYIILIL